MEYQNHIKLNKEIITKKGISRIDSLLTQVTTIALNGHNNLAISSIFIKL